MKTTTPSIATQAQRPSKSKHVESAHQASEKEPAIRLNVDIPESLHKSVKAKAAQDGKTMREVVLAFLTDYAEK